MFFLASVLLCEDIGKQRQWYEWVVWFSHTFVGTTRLLKNQDGSRRSETATMLRASGQPTMIFQGNQIEEQMRKNEDANQIEAFYSIHETFSMEIFFESPQQIVSRVRVAIKIQPQLLWETKSNILKNKLRKILWNSIISLDAITFAVRLANEVSSTDVFSAEPCHILCHKNRSKGNGIRGETFWIGSRSMLKWVTTFTHKQTNVIKFACATVLNCEQFYGRVFFLFTAIWITRSAFFRVFRSWLQFNLKHDNGVTQSSDCCCKHTIRRTWFTKQL